MGLVEFLLARIGEDEDEARKAALTVGWDGFGEQRIRSGQNWIPSYHVVKRVRDDGPTDRREVADCGALFGISTANHIARWDPARVLAECAAKQRIVEAAEDATDSAESEGGGVTWIPEPWMTVLRLLAQPYADHPDYDPAWNPEATQ